MYAIDKVSADILNVTVLEYLTLLAVAERRGECPCTSCLAGEGDRLCVECHYRYAVCGQRCVKCYAYEEQCDFEDQSAARVDALGLQFGVVDAWKKYLAEEEGEYNWTTERQIPLEWADARGRVVQAW